MLTENINHHALSGKTILVTGASRGIGREAAVHFAQHGATVVLLARNVRDLESVYDKIIDLNCPMPAIFPMDLGSAGPEQFQQLYDALLSEFGKLDGLLHNAGMLGQLTPIAYTDPRNWQEIIQVNLNAPFLLTQTCLPLLKKTNQASVIFTTSHFPNHSKAYWGAYAVAKQGQIALMQTLAEELTHQEIYVNALNPGPIRSPLRAAAYPAEDKKQLLTAKAVMPAYLKLIQAYRYNVRGQVIQAQNHLHTQKLFIENAQEEELIA